MPGERLSMRKIREVLRPRLGQGLPRRAVAQSLRLSQGAVHGYVARARRPGLAWPLPEGLDDARLETLASGLRRPNCMSGCRGSVPARRRRGAVTVRGERGESGRFFASRLRLNPILKGDSESENRREPVARPIHAQTPVCERQCRR